VRLPHAPQRKVRRPTLLSWPFSLSSGACPHARAARPNAAGSGRDASFRCVCHHVRLHGTSGNREVAPDVLHQASMFEAEAVAERNEVKPSRMAAAGGQAVDRGFMAQCQHLADRVDPERIGDFGKPEHSSEIGLMSYVVNRQTCSTLWPRPSFIWLCSVYISRRVYIQPAGAALLMPLPVRPGICWLPRPRCRAAAEQPDQGPRNVEMQTLHGDDNRPLSIRRVMIAPSSDQL